MLLFTKSVNMDAMGVGGLMVINGRAGFRGRREVEAGMYRKYLSINKEDTFRDFWE